MADEKEMGKAEATCTQIPWAYLRKGEWTILSKEDSEKLEDVYKSGEPVVVDDGRLLVSVVDRTLTALYWDEPSCPVVRAEWLFETSSGKFVPLSEAEAIDINNLWATLTQTDVHSFSLNVHDHISGLSTKKGDTTIPAEQKLNEIFAKCSPTSSHRCKAIHHGYPNWTDIKRTVKHVVFVVHGIGETYCKKRLASGTIIDQSLILRQLTSSILDSNYPAGFENTIEYLPVDWSDVLGDMGDDLHAKLNRIALDTMPFVRQISNELLSDILMYMARQNAVLTYVAKYMNQRYHLYRQSHPEFDGTISIMGHSLGSVISYDLLSKQDHESEFALDFAPQTFFAFGSPIGLFLALRGNISGDDLRLPTCSNMYNIFHPSDPVAYRLEPLIHKAATILPPVRISTFSGWRRLHHVVQDFADSLESGQKKFAQQMEQTFRVFLPKDAHLTHDDATVKTQEGDAIQKSILEAINPKAHRLDFVLPESEIDALTPLSALTAHTGYWSTKDFVLFIMSQLLGEPQGAISN